jgi:ADP-heptose:LPS heptosyltransferase
MRGMINRNCRYYRAARPCIFNKQDGSECGTCTHASEFRDRILFIKLDAIGDVLRSASVIPILRQRHHAPYIAWVTRAESADMVRLIDGVDEVIELDATTQARVAAGGWDFVYSLSNDMPSAALAAAAGAANPPVGFFLKDGILRASNMAAEGWLELAAFDRLKHANTKSYQRWMCDILGHDGPIVPPALKLSEDLLGGARTRVATLLPGPRRSRIAIHVGAGSRWPKKMLRATQITVLAQRLRQAGADVLLLGGQAESEKLEAVQRPLAGDARVQNAMTDTSIPELAALMTQVDFLICGDSLALHVATAMGLPALSLFGPTSIAEIHDFQGLITKKQTEELDCLGCYGDCNKPRNCMSVLEPGDIARQALALLSARGMARASA